MQLGDIQRLRSELDALDAALLARVVHSQPDPLDADERIQIDGFIVLAHGTIEGFLEDCFFDYVEGCTTADSNGLVDPGIYQVVVQLAPMLEGQKTVSTHDLMSKLRGLVKKNVIGQSHGIKRKYVKKLALGTGVDWPDLDSSCPDLLAALDALGSARGSPAHMGSWGASAGLRQDLYPDNARDLVDAVVTHLPSLVNYLSASPNAALPPQSSMKARRAQLRSHRADLKRWWAERPRRSHVPDS